MAATRRRTGIVDKGARLLGRAHADDNYKWMKEHIKEAKGVLIYPQVLKAGFIFGGSGGTGVLLARDERPGTGATPLSTRWVR